MGNVTYEDLPAGERAELYFKALELIQACNTMPFFVEGQTKEEPARQLAVKMYEQRIEQKDKQ